MRALFKAVLFFLLPAAPAMAEPLSFSFSAGGGAYLVEVLFPQPPEDRKQLAPAVITVRNPATQEVLQQLQTQAGNIPLDRDGKDNGWMLGRFSLVYFDDFNFDGRPDLAIRNGDDPEVAYKGNYDVYLQDPRSNQWVINRALTNLAKESNGGMFAVIPDDELFSQTDRDGHWTRTCRWKMQGDELVRLHCDTEDTIQPTEYGGSSSMPRGYTRRTVGDLKDGQWQERSTLDGPASEDPQMFVGRLQDHVPLEIWYQKQGAVVIGEVRYLKATGAESVRLVGTREDEGDDEFVNLYEYADDGRRMGQWRIARENVDPYRYVGTWTRADKDNQQIVVLREDERESDDDKTGDVELDQRSGHYEMRQGSMGRDGNLDLKILPDRNADGKEMAEFTVTLKGIVTEHQIVPMETANLIVVSQAQTTGRNGPYHIQLVKNVAVINHNGPLDSRDMLSGMYLKQPLTGENGALPR
jgi:hypothetical protein